MVRKKNTTNETTGKNKKLISFAPHNAELCMGIVHDIATKENTSDSAMVESAIISAYISSNDKVIYYARELYRHGIKTTIGMLFQELAAGVGFAPAYNNGLPLIEYTRRMSTAGHQELTGDEPILEHFILQCKFLSDVIETSKAEDEMTLEERYSFEDFKLMVKQLPDNFNAFNYVAFIINNYELVKDSTFVYRLLYGLTELSTEWEESSTNRLEALRIIKDVVEVWG